jgi:cell division protein ZapA (FtsZ GTPase activity inhibitor)
MPGSDEQRAYDRGRRDTRIDGHDADIHKMHSTLKELLKLTIKLDKHVLRLAINAANAAESALTMAAALKVERDDAAAALKTEKDDAAAALKAKTDDARDTAEAEAEKSSSRWGKLQTIAAFASVVIAFLGYEYITHPHG